MFKNNNLSFLTAAKKVNNISLLLHLCEHFSTLKIFLKQKVLKF
jgi:hypothetical protein